VPSAKDQVDSFLSWDAPQPGDVFVHWIGANDILFNTTITGAQITSIVSEDIDRLYRAGKSDPATNPQRTDYTDIIVGARNIILANYNEFDTFPATYNSSYYNIPSVQAFDDDLSTGLVNIAAAYSAYAKTAFVDVRQLFRNITAQPSAYGINEAYVDPPTACLVGVYTSEGVPRHLCSDPERHVFFDSYHPVTQVHALIAKMFEDAIRSFA
jgi:phospholipase/lecithinase/hemolysin